MGCEKKIIQITVVPGTDTANSTNYPCVTYSCNHCQTIISTSIDPLWLKSVQLLDIVTLIDN